MAEAHLARRWSSAFVERVNSAAKLTLGDFRPHLADDEPGDLATLRINRAFMEYILRLRFPSRLDILVTV